MDNRTDEERLLELVEKRASKFLNRALPDPPVAPLDTTTISTPTDPKSRCAEAAGNFYELVQADAAVRHIPGTYEDIESVGDTSSTRVRHDRRSTSFPSQNSIAGRTPVTPVQNPVVDEEYMEPVIPAGERPSPAPRTSCEDNLKVHQATYSNCENERKDNASEIPSTLSQCFAAMDKINRETLKLVASKKYALSLKCMKTDSVKMTWSEFELIDVNRPHFVQNHVSFYRSKHQHCAPNGCVLMVSNLKRFFWL